MLHAVENKPSSGPGRNAPARADAAAPAIEAPGLPPRGERRSAYGNQTALRMQGQGPRPLPPSRILQRQCACGGTCSHCHAEAAHAEAPPRATVQAKSSAEASHDPQEREADRIAAEIAPDIEGAGGSSVSGSDEFRSDRSQALPGGTRAAMEAALGTSFRQVRLHTGPRAQTMTRALRAQAFAHGRDIYFDAGRYDPRSTAGRHLVAHELVHVAQQARRGQAAVQRKSDLDALPEAEREKVQVLTTPATPEWQKVFDEDYQNAVAVPLPAGLTIQFGASVAQFRQKGLTSVAGSLTNVGAPRTAVGKAFVPRNSALDLAIAAAQAVFRFTRLDRPSTAPAGAAPGGPVPEVLVIEEIAPIPPERKPMWEAFPGPFSEAQGPLPPREADRMRDCLAEGADIDACRRIVLGVGAPPSPPNTLDAGNVEIRKVKMKRGAGWKDNDWKLVAAALESLPDVGLKQAEGVSFLRDSVKVCKPEEVTAGTCDAKRSGETDSLNKKITLFDTAFVESTTRYGTSTWLQQVVAHEIGHEADYRPLGAAWAQFKKSGDETKVLAARSRSGNAFIKHTLKGKNLYQSTEVGDGATKGSFREAAIKDGLQVTAHNKQITGGGITAYGETGWQELFAESFALYMLDPDLLKAIRPNCSAYLEKVYPKPAAATP